jgi:hypothetical protein
MLRWLTALLAILMLSASVASAQDGGTAFDPCANPQYAQLLSYNFSDDVIRALRTQDVEIHFIDSLFFDYGQEYHYDWYAVTLNMPESLSAQALLSEMVAHPNHAVQSIIFNALGEFTPRRPESDSPRVGDIYDIDVLGPEDGSVMLTELATDHYIFTTLTTDETGSHPTPGARVWGFTRDDASGDVTFYTRGVSRTDVPDPGIGEFAQSEFWEALFEGIADRVVDEGGRLIAPLQSQTWNIDPDNQPSCATVVEEWNFTWANERIDCGSSYITYYDFLTTVTTTDNGQSLTRLAIGGAQAQFERNSDQSYVLVNREYNDLDAVVQSETLRYESVSLIVGERTDYFPNLNCSVTNPYRMELIRTIDTGGSPGADCIPDKESDCTEQ